jgi:hypothetical protein
MSAMSEVLKHGLFAVALQDYGSASSTGTNMLGAAVF